MKLTEQQIAHFHEKGWVGPLDTFSTEEIEQVKQCIESHSEVITELNGKKSLKLYNNVYNIDCTSRDHHLFHEPIKSLVTSPKIVERLNQIESSDLLLWRTDIFYLFPNQGATGWHQYKEYYWMFDIDYEKPQLDFSKNPKAINFTVWVALEDVPIEKGCLQFANRTHKKPFKILANSVDAEESTFANYRNHKSVYKGDKIKAGTFEFEPTDWELEIVPVKAGQIIIFTESVMHSSLPNISNSYRLSISASYIHPSVAIYSHRLKGDFIDQNNHDIQRHFSILVSGKDEYNLNVVRDNHDLSPIETEFQKASNLVRFNHVELPQNKQQIEIYGLEKQSIKGDCNEEEPDAILHPRQYIQWQAWKRYQGMSREEAMKRYTEIVANLPRKKTPKNAGPAEQQMQAQTEITAWLVAYTAELLEIESVEIDITADVDSYGLDSVTLINLLGNLEQWLGCEIEPSLLSEYSSIEALAKYLAQEVKVKPRTVYV